MTEMHSKPKGRKIREGFVAVVNRKDGTPVYLRSHLVEYGTDEHLATAPDNVYIRDSVPDAISDVRYIKTVMREHYGDDTIDFDTARVVRYSETVNLEEIDPNEIERIAKEAEDAEALKDVKALLTPEECDLLYAHWSQMDKELGRNG